jgi:hypothetical protein
VFGRLEVTEPIDEGSKGTFDRRVDDDLVPDDRIMGQVHVFSSGG